jgi:hypothetical protein
MLGSATWYRRRCDCTGADFTSFLFWVAAAASCPVCLWLSRLLLTLQAMSAGNPGSFPKRSLSSMVPGCFHAHSLQTSEAAPMASLSLPSSQGRSEGRAVRPKLCLRCTIPGALARPRPVTARLSCHRDDNWRRRPLVDLRRDQRRRPVVLEKNAPLFPVPPSRARSLREKQAARGRDPVTAISGT